MALWVHAYCGYASYDQHIGWGQAEYDAKKFVHLLKGHAINGFVRLKKPDGGWVKMTTEVPGGAFEIWRQWAGRKADQLVPGGALIVPIPTASATHWGQDPKGERLAKLAANGSAKSLAVEALHWAENLGKAAEGGPRNAAVIYANARINTDIQPQRLILVDDVVTAGGHLLACARALRFFGHTVEHAICAGRTVKTPPPNGMFSIPAFDLEAPMFG